MNRRLAIGAATIAALLPMAPLLVFWGGFFWDWYNGLWMAGYPGEFLRQHGELPAVLSSRVYIGVPAPVFYGYLLYPVLGTLSSVVGASAAVRLLAVAVWLLQFFLVQHVVWSASRRRGLAFAIASIMAWTPYPLTNLYNRSAISEFFAAAFVTCAVCCWLLLLLRPGRIVQAVHAVSACLLLTFAASSHPITAAVAAVACGALVVCSVPVLRRFGLISRSSVLVVLGCSAAAVAVLSPWLYALYRYSGQLDVRVKFGITIYDEIDHPIARFFPVPFDIRGLLHGVDNVATPYLDAQMSVPLLLVAAWAAVEVWRRRAWRSPFRHLAWSSGILVVVMVTLSLSRSVYSVLPDFVGVVQFGYRFVTYQNLFLFTGLVALLACRFEEAEEAPGTDRPDLVGSSVVAGAWAVGAIGLVIKLTHVWAIAGTGPAGGPEYRADEIPAVRRTIEARLVPSDPNVRPPRGYGLGWGERDALVDMPKLFYGAGDYAISAGYVPVDNSIPIGELDLPVGTGAQFGIPQPVSVNLSREVWVATSVLAFPWNGLEVDGRLLDRSELRLARNRLAVRLGPGSHTILAKIAPDGTWLWLRRLSISIFLIWVLFTAAAWIRVARRRTGMGDGEAAAQS